MLGGRSEGTFPVVTVSAMGGGLPATRVTWAHIYSSSCKASEGHPVIPRVLGDPIPNKGYWRWRRTAARANRQCLSVLPIGAVPVPRLPIQRHRSSTITTIPCIG